MQLTKKQTNDILKIYDTWMHSYLNGDVQTYDSYFDDDYHFIGSTNNEEFLNRSDTTKFFKVTAEQFSGKTNLRNETKTLERFGELIFLTHIFDAWFLNGTEWTYYGRFRFSSVLQETKEGWKFIYQHFSIADSKTDEGETIGYDKVHAENQELREAIKRRTVELETKNRELEIEGAIEKVRSRTMAMQHSDELQEASFLLDEQVRALGIKTWGCAFNIYGENDATEWFGNEAGVLPTYTVPRKGIFKEYYQKGQQGASIYIKEFSGKDCVVHYEYMSTLPVIGDVLKNLKKANNGFPTYQIDHVVYFKYGYLLFITKEHVPDAHDVFKRFSKVFEQTYTRFLDLQKAEAQTREAQIETALEKVRSRSMAMHNSEELLDVITVVSEQLQALDFKFVHVSFAYNDHSPDYNFWVSAKGQPKPIRLTTPYINIAVFNNLRQAINQSLSFCTDIISKKEHIKWHKHLLKHVDSKVFSKADNEFIMSRGMARSMAINPNIILILANYASIPYSEEDNKIIARFGQVFEQSYTRFLDLQKAEEQAKEALIEAAIERVRSRSMAMHKSEELKDVVKVIFDQMALLNINADHAGIVVDYEPKKDFNFWVADNQDIPAKITVPYLDLPWDRLYTDAKKKGKDFFTMQLNFEEKNLFYKKLLPHIEGLTTEAEDFYLNCPGLAASTVVQKDIGLYIENFSGTTFSDAENSILKRFGKVFQQTYTRFLDLQKAESQAREAQIEAALEKVRTVALSLEKSDDMLDIATVLFEQLLGLGFDHIRNAIIDVHIDNDNFIDYDYSHNMQGTVTKMRYSDDPSLEEQFRQVVASKDELFELILEGQELQNLIDMRINNGEAEDTRLRNAEQLTYNMYSFGNGAIGISNFGLLSSDEKDILKRFRNVFTFAYNRYSELALKESQARKAQIDIALERVRNRTMAMQNSSELPEAANNLFLQVQELGIPAWSAGYCIWENDDKKSAWCNMSSEGEIQKGFSLPTIGEGYNFNKPLNNKESFHVAELGGDALVKHYEFMKTLPTIGDILAEFDLKGISLPTFQIFHIVFFSHGYLMFITYEDVTNEWDIFKRFGKVFQQTYTRFLDLQKAEAQGREARIEAALERVRNAALSLKKSDDMLDIAKELYVQLVGLGFSNIRNAIIDIHNDEDETFMDYDYSHEMSGTVTKMSYYDDPIITEQVRQIESSHDAFFELILEGKTLQDLIDVRRSNGEADDERLMNIDQLSYNLYSFGNGAIGISNFGILNKEEKVILRRFTTVFTFAYQRFLDLQEKEVQTKKLADEKLRLEKTLADLQETQEQLIQSEKMASLGELTAGIAHEIQNPLNFVNNFSEVSQELLEEMLEELEKGDTEEVKAILNDITQNLEKINHHGKRADGIVKGMLQHSRATGDKKEPTDLNVLADEYLRLAYHGLRAKDKSFNATLETNFANNLKKINIIPQDIGRVILNLLTNAFYVVHEKKKSGLENYEPTVSISTKKIKDNQVIKVTDNGNGMSNKVKEKIFQPFFTTKPTGQGTGLGLSMSYDIITKGHGGELKVETKASIGTTFTITLPTN